MNASDALVSIVMRTYNTAAVVPQAIESALGQDVSVPKEIVVVDDGSTDGTLRQLERYGERIRLISCEHCGAIAALNTGIRESNGTFFTILDSDDALLPGGVAALYEPLRTETAKGFAYGDYRERDAVTGREELVSTRESLLHTVAGGILFRKDVVTRLGGYDDTLVFPEYDVLLKLQEEFGGIHVPVPVYLYVRRVGSITSEPQRVMEGKRQLEERYGPLPDLRNY